MFTGAESSALWRYIQIFKINTVLALPGRVTEKVNRKADGVAVVFADQAMGMGCFAKQRIVNMLRSGFGFVLLATCSLCNMVLSIQP